MPESDAAIQSRNLPDEYGEIISHGPIEMGVWQPRLETERKKTQDDAGSHNTCHNEFVMRTPYADTDMLCN
jgi:hypothetical protein